MAQLGSSAPINFFYDLLRLCIDKKDLEAAREIRCLIAQNGYESNSFLASHLIRLFTLCGSLLEANEVFRKVLKPNAYTWSAIIAAHANLRQGDRALQLYYQMQNSGFKSDAHIFVAALKACTNALALTHGKLIHCHVVQSGFESNLFVGNTLLNMYSKCGCIDNARRVFDMLPVRDLISWSAIIAGYTENKHGQEVFPLFHRMQEQGIRPNNVTYVSVLKACSITAALNRGKSSHYHIIENGFESDVFVGCTLIDMYVKCRSLPDARRLFDKFVERSVVTCNAMILGYTQHGKSQDALEIFHLMQGECVEPDDLTFVSILKACCSAAALEQGKLIHTQVINSGSELDLFISSTLIDMYAKFGSLEDACRVFYGLPSRDAVTWSGMIRGYIQHGYVEKALRLFQQMQQEGRKADTITYANILKACSTIATLDQVKRIHTHIIENDLKSDEIVGCNLIDMYFMHGNIDSACTVFDNLPKEDVVTWNTMIAGYGQCGHAHEAFEVFRKMQHEGRNSDHVTFVNILKALLSRVDLEKGKLVHIYVIKNGLEAVVLICNTLIDIYAKCGSVQDACKVFEGLQRRDVVTWSTMIGGFVYHGHALEALQLFQRMQGEGIGPNNFTLVSILKACSDIQALNLGKSVHAQMIEKHMEVGIITGNTLINMYAKCGSLKDACKLFNDSPMMDLVTWTTMIAAYADFENSKEAIKVFQHMQQYGMEPNNITFVSILKACSCVSALDQGKLLHVNIIKSGFELDEYVGSTLIHMYAKCGSLADACKVFSKVPTQDMVTWSAMISGFALHSDRVLALKYFDDMQQRGLKPPNVMYVCLLSALNRVGFLDEGCHQFRLMRQEYDISPRLEHYNCIADLFSRAGCLNEAEDVLQTMPWQPDMFGWTSLLSNCKTYGNLGLGRLCFDRVVSIQDSHASGYMLMSNIYASANMWTYADNVR